MAATPLQCFAQTAKPGGKSGAAIKDGKYGPHERNAFDLWKAPSEKPTPLVVFIPGGGFYRGRKEALSSTLLTQLLERGISVMAINYRLSPEVSFPAHYMDCARAIQFARSRAEEWNIDPDRVASTGGSAGAGTGLWIAFHDDMANPSDPDPVLRQSTRLRCVAVTDPQTSYDPRIIKEWVGESAAIHPMLLPFFGVKPEDRDTAQAHELYEAASPVNLLTSDDPPVYANYSEDAPIPANAKPGQGIHHINFGIHLKEKMDALKIPCTVCSLKEHPEWDREIAEFFAQRL